MHRLSLILVVAAACGGSPKSPPTAPLPDDTKATPPVAETPPPAPEAKPPAPPKPAPPVDIKVPAQATTVKLVSGGKGKKEPIRYALKEGAKQAIELALDFTGKQDDQEKTVPTILLTASAEIKTLGKDGTAQYAMTVTGTDARETPGSQQIPIDQFKQVVSVLSGLAIGGTIGTNGVTGDVTLHMETPPPHAVEALELIRVALPRMPVLPTEPVGVGAKWQATSSAKLADRLEVTQVTDYELVAHKGATWTIKGTTKVTGKDQEIEANNVSDIAGTGTLEATIDGGSLYPTFKSSVETQFKASDKTKTQSAKYTIRIGGGVMPKDAAVAAAAAAAAAPATDTKPVVAPKAPAPPAPKK